MTLFIQNDAVGGGAGTVNANQAFVDTLAIANLDTGLGLGPVAGNLQQVTYARTDAGIPPVRLDTLVNTAFGVVPPPGGPDILLLAVGANFTLNDGTLITNVGGTALPPAGSGMPGAGLNGTASCLVLYDTSNLNGAGYCAARAGTGGTLDLPISTSEILYHELSHAFRIVTTGLLALTANCNPSSPEENAAIVDENDMRTQRAAQLGVPVVLRDPGIHCGTSCGGGGGGSCCIIASVASGSALSEDVAQLRTLRDQFLRSDEIGYAFFDSLHYVYYGFSPQVATVMAGETELRSTVLHGFVRPLIRMLQLIRDHTIGAMDGPELGRSFMAGLGDGADARFSLAVLDRVLAIMGDRDDGSPPLTTTERSVADLLMERALSDEHVSWALVEPVRAYHACLRAWDRGATGEDIGRSIEDFLVRWCGRLPVAARWGKMSTEEVAAALDLLDDSLLRKARPRRIFYGRLMDRYGEATAVRDVVRSRTEVPQ